MKKCPNSQEVCQSLLVNIPAVTKNNQDCDVEKSLKCTGKNPKFPSWIKLGYALDFVKSNLTKKPILVLSWIFNGYLKH